MNSMARVSWIQPASIYTKVTRVYSELQVTMHDTNMQLLLYNNVQLCLYCPSQQSHDNVPESAKSQ